MKKQIKTAVGGCGFFLILSRAVFIFVFLVFNPQVEVLFGFSSFQNALVFFLFKVLWFFFFSKWLGESVVNIPV